MLVRLLLLLTVVPLVELLILLQLADRFSWRSTLLLVLATGAAGAWLARREGFRTLGRIQSDLAAGKPPTGPLMDAALIVVAGLLLVTPGVLTDVVGFALLIPPVRRRIRRRMAAALKKRVVVMRTGGPHPSGTAQPTEFIDVVGVGRDANAKANADLTADADADADEPGGAT